MNLYFQLFVEHLVFKAKQTTITGVMFLSLISYVLVLCAYEIYIYVLFLLSFFDCEMNGNNLCFFLVCLSYSIELYNVFFLCDSILLSKMTDT